MSESQPRQPRFSVGRPLKRVAVVMEPVVPLDGPVTDGPLIHVRHPLKRATLTFEPVGPTATVRLTLPLAAGDDGPRLFEMLHALVAKVNEMEALIDSAGVRVDGALSGVQSSEIVIVLASNDPIYGVDICKRVADILFAASRKAPRVKVFAADQPETPVYELPLAI